MERSARALRGSRPCVQAALPPNLAAPSRPPASRRGVSPSASRGAVWASRLRVCTDTLRKRVGESMGVEIQSVRIKGACSAAVILRSGRHSQRMRRWRAFSTAAHARAAAAT